MDDVMTWCRRPTEWDAMILGNATTYETTRTPWEFEKKAYCPEDKPGGLEEVPSLWKDTSAN